MATQSATIAFIGAGNMASALIGGMINNGHPADKIWASDLNEEALANLKAQYGINVSSDNDQIVAQADALILAVKPQVLQVVSEGICDAVQASKPLIISIAAGIPLAPLEQWLGGELSVVRCMPNTPALVQLGATGLFGNSRVSAEQQSLADGILAAVGSNVWVATEEQLDAVTAVSGSGPAYFFLIMEAMTQAGEKLGLPAELASQLSLQTALGAARMALDSDVDAAELRRRVTSPGGTTAAALQVMEDAKLRDTFVDALSAADARAKSLADELTG